MGEIPVLPGTQPRGLGLLQLRPVRAVDGEGEAAAGEAGARLVVDEAVGAVVVDDLRGGEGMGK